MGTRFWSICPHPWNEYDNNSTYLQTGRRSEWQRVCKAFGTFLAQSKCFQMFALAFECLFNDKRTKWEVQKCWTDGTSNRMNSLNFDKNSLHICCCWWDACLFEERHLLKFARKKEMQNLNLQFPVSLRKESAHLASAFSSAQGWQPDPLHWTVQVLGKIKVFISLKMTI